ncbi:O-antigen ligase family protein [Clostridium sp. MT-14]|uniref:O-antigen ligase family protein n=1 Tax=Clostridium aromativorans TaxID=2836848 RepID=A0ABS8NB19_9CLOT|nr:MULTISPECIES: O-antigen ligase family protein [Clostridium]KAA8675776.1 O-antigen ligase domain-containing protein [Clostridium sp. HV4-5-A1G]MCC9295893.1 O-antigen ligase family protein [Clostridium aromativorans]
MKTASNGQSRIVYILIILSLIANYLMFPSLIVVQLFAAFYVTIIYKKFITCKLDLIYFSTLLFAIINFSLKIPIGSRYEVYYFYVTLFIYMLFFIYGFVKHYNNIGFDLIKNNKYFIFISIFIVYMLFGFFISEDKKLSIKYIFNFFIMISLMIMMIWENRSRTVMNKSLKLLEYIYMGVLFLGTLEIFGVRYGVRNHFEEWDPIVTQISYVKKIPVVFFYNPNNYAAFLVIGMTILIGAWLFTNSRFNKRIYLLLYFISQLNLIFTRSRTAWITIFIVLLFMIIFYSFSNNRSVYNIKRLAILATVTIAVFLGISFIPNMQPFYGKITGSRLLSKLNIFNSDYRLNPQDEKLLQLGKKGSENERYTLIYDVVHGVIIQKHYLGFGPGNIENYVKKMNNTFGVLNVHSFWFEILGNFGVAIFLYTIYIYANMIRSPLRSYDYSDREMKKYSIMFSSNLFGIVFLSFGPSTIMWYTPFWISMGMSMALITSNRKI